MPLITQQILKPLAQHHHADIYFMLAYASVSKNEFALTRHWLSKYIKTTDFDLTLLQPTHCHLDLFAMKLGLVQ